MKKVVLVHGWGGSPEKDWFPWLREELEKRKFEVIVPEMPDTMHPKIEAWVEKLKDSVKEVDEETYLIGHSIGCQTIMRFLERLDKKVGGVIFVAGWFNLTDETWDDEGFAKEIADPWLDTKIDFNKIKNNSRKFTAILSDNDPYVPVSDSAIFKEKLGAEIIILKNQGHITEEDGIKGVPIVLTKFLEIAE